MGLDIDINTINGRNIYSHLPFSLPPRPHSLLLHLHSTPRLHHSNMSNNMELSLEGEEGHRDDLAEGGRSSGWWRLAKRVAIAGVVVTSAPFVVPPLLLISTIGLVFSMPCMILFFGYIATRKIIGYLLSPEKPIAQLLPLEGPEGEGALQVFDEMPAKEETVEGVVDPSIPWVDVVGGEPMVGAFRGESMEVEGAPEMPETGVTIEEGVNGLDEVMAEIDALRVIVGSTAAQLASPIEELKALYIFTGIEPPTSLREGCNPEEIRSRLKFLKSVVGVQ